MNTIPRSIYHRPWTIGAALAAPILPLLSQASPNLVFIMADQYRGDALGCIGKEPVKTPCLDKLASEGIVFTDAVSSYPVSSPARAMLMTGMYPINNKVVSNCNSRTAPY
ncbi:sulfatase-like hydrolase/transferase, partial [Bacteroides sp. RTP21281st1_H5_RTP21281_210402]